MLLAAVIAAPAAADDGPDHGPPPARGARAPAPGRPAPSAPVGRLDARVRYLAVLKQTGAGVEQASQALAELEREVFADGSFRALAELHRYQATMMSVLGARDPECLKPIVWLQREVGERQRAERDVLSLPSRVHGGELALAMHRQRLVAADRAFATDVALCTAYSILEDNQKSRATALLERVVGLEPASPSALLGLAAVHERLGRHEQAAAVLERLVADHPGSAEGRLRLAVNLARLRRYEEAQARFEELLASPAATWLRVVGEQELARLLLARGQLDAAAAELERAVAELPDHGLRVQLAMVLDLQQRPAAAAAVVEGIEPMAAGGEPAARWRYSLWPELDTAARVERLRGMAAAAAPALARVLETTAEDHS